MVKGQPEQLKRQPKGGQKQNHKYIATIYQTLIVSTLGLDTSHTLAPRLPPAIHLVLSTASTLPPPPSLYVYYISTLILYVQPPTTIVTTCRNQPTLSTPPTPPVLIAIEGVVSTVMHCITVGQHTLYQSPLLTNTIYLQIIILNG